MKLVFAAVIGSTVLAVVGLAAGQAQPPLTLEMLTVPASMLPEGCTLRPIVNEPRPAAVSLPITNAQGVLRRTFTVGFGDSTNAFASNPFIARERSDVYRIRTAIDGGVGAARYPDAPPLTAEEIAAFQMRYVQHAIDGYWAAYATPQNDSVEVCAIRFDDPSLALDTPTRRPGTFEPYSPKPAANTKVGERIVKGAMVVVLRGSSATRCFDTVKAHVQALR